MINILTMNHSYLFIYYLILFQLTELREKGQQWSRNKRLKDKEAAAAVARATPAVPPHMNVPPKPVYVIFMN